MLVKIIALSPGPSPKERPGTFILVIQGCKNTWAFHSLFLDRQEITTVIIPIER